MPAGFAGSKAANRFSILDYVRNNIDFRMALHKAPASLLHRRAVEFTKATTEGNEVGVGQFLPSKQQDLMIEPCAVNGFKLIRLNFSDIYTLNLGAERLTGWDDLHGDTSLRRCRLDISFRPRSAHASPARELH